MKMVALEYYSWNDILLLDGYVGCLHNHNNKFIIAVAVHMQLNKELHYYKCGVP